MSPLLARGTAGHIACRMTVRALDFTRFGKIRALAERTDNEGERLAAQDALRVMARRAGLSLGQALAADDERRRPRNPLRALFNTADQRRDRVRRRAVRAMIEEGMSDRRIAQALEIPITVVRAVRSVML